MTRVVGYVRVSTGEQSPALQVEALREIGADPVHEDRASGAKADRPGLRKALDELQAGDTLAVWKLDRLGRSIRQLIDTMETIRERGAFFRSITDGIDTNTAAGRMLYAVLGALAEYERAVIVERVKAGLASSRRAGRIGGRPSKMTFEKTLHARRLLAEGETWATVARLSGVSKTTLVRAFRRFPEGE